ncbi:hypothetical protein [Vreelandella boliviensis]|uniref:Uncharacterized protein n=1 Tax=Vreelandella boliviensis LC1 TaxID=1072583 RepID=A0A265E2Q2_9GAMM|nr:hypothetical protein [Halomonas boliviensis]EHJ93614.1 hypothetical protein KUC_0563 [Halomonas boliviensis LC1]OZT75872.1 hypothetical protein CE457_01200 [Halomonas boliviensis LC1]
MDRNVESLERVLKNVSEYERIGLDTSYLKAFIKNYKLFLELHNIESDLENNSYSDRMKILESILSDKKLFPRIIDIVEFSNKNLDIEFRSQKASRDTTISRIIKRAEKDVEFKENLKSKLTYLINDGYYKEQKKTVSSKKSMLNDLDKWAKMLKDL